MQAIRTEIEFVSLCIDFYLSVRAAIEKLHWAFRLDIS